MKHVVILAGTILLAFGAAPAVAGDRVDRGSYYYDDDDTPYDPYYDNSYYGGGGYYDSYAPRYRRKYRRGRYYGGLHRRDTQGGLPTAAQVGNGMRGR